MELQQQANSGVFINGKAQIIEMLKHMPDGERQKLLQNIRIRNPQLANELVAQSLSFDHIVKLNGHEITLLIQYIAAPVLGVALKDSSREVQKQILSSVPRAYAEETYKMMITPLSNEKRDISRAQNKIISVLVALSKRKQINLH